jgi:glucose/arabinose dehydrogenase
MRMNPDGTGLEVFARGVRNTVGFDWHPETKTLWFTDNGRDWLGDDVPPDELNHAPRKGLHFGFPYCHGGDISDPEFGKKHACEEFVPPAMKLGPHVAAIGMRFYTGTMFPDRYRNQIFIAEHGSWNRSTPIGYRVTLVRLEENRAGWCGLKKIAQQRIKSLPRAGSRAMQRGGAPRMCWSCPMVRSWSRTIERV